MLDGARDTGGNIERGAHDLAGLADLVGVLDPTGVNRRAGGANGTTERVWKSTMNTLPFSIRLT